MKKMNFPGHRRLVLGDPAQPIRAIYINVPQSQKNEIRSVLYKFGAINKLKTTDYQSAMPNIAKAIMREDG
ncbi:MAG: hypothetical protein HQK65_12960 [Desulfamplus sp.]|nr:hypothetical protein [Desulfamplus sp.]